MDRLVGLRIIKSPADTVPQESYSWFTVDRYEWILFERSEGSIAINGENVFMDRPCMLLPSPGDMLIANQPLRFICARWPKQPDADISHLKYVYLPDSSARECGMLMEQVRIFLRRSAKLDLESRQIAANMLKIAWLILKATEKDETPVQKEHALLADSMMDWMEAHPEKELPIEHMTRVTGKSRSYLYKGFVEQTGVTPGNFRERLRIERTCTLLAGTNLTTAQIARKCGFSSAAYLVKVFGEEVGMTPGEYRLRRR